MMKVFEVTLYMGMAATICGMAVWGAPVCAQVTIAAITAAQGLCVALR